MAHPANRIQRKGVARLLYALRYSCEGLAACWREQEAFRLEVALAAVLIPVVLLTRATRLEKALLIASVFGVLVVELLNSAIETFVDLASPEIHPLAKRAKDVGSAAVLVSLIALGAIWALVLLF